jgi:hypothetical protein
MVPAAIERTVDGKRGTLQHLPQSLISETRRVTENLHIDAWCPLKDQWQAMYLFDALIFNRPRTAEEIHYSPSSGELILTGHDGAFGTESGIPEHLQSAGLSVNGLWRRRLAGLDSDVARDRLMEVLTARQLQALLKRARALAK